MRTAVAEEAETIKQVTINSITTAANERAEAEFQENFKRDIGNIEISRLAVYGDGTHLTQMKKNMQVYKKHGI